MSRRLTAGANRLYGRVRCEVVLTNLSLVNGMHSLLSVNNARVKLITYTSIKTLKLKSYSFTLSLQAQTFQQILPTLIDFSYHLD